MHRTPLLSAAAAALALAVPATAGATSPREPLPPMPVPAGEIQHTVRTVSWETDIGKPWAHRMETWLSADAARSVQRDPKTGELVSECAETAGEVRCYAAEKNEITVFPSPGGTEPRIVDSWAREGLAIQRQVDMGWFVFGADTTFDGRPAKQLEDTPSAPSDTESRHYVTAEPETLFPLKRVITGTAKTNEGEQHFTQTDVVGRREVLETGDVSLAFGDHPGATVRRIGDRTASAARSRKRALARKRAAAKKRALAKRRAAQKARRSR
jgi:hypothetical protein